MQDHYGEALGGGMGVEGEGQVKILKESNFWSRDREAWLSES